MHIDIVGCDASGQMYCRLVADAPGSYIFLAMLQNMYINFQVVAVFYLFVDKKFTFYEHLTRA
jgi:hypothetical protein